MPSPAALLRAAHAVPCIAVTVFATALGGVAGNGVTTCALLAVAILAGQLLIGWTNDRLDAAADTAAGRTDKPVASGAVSLRALDTARGVAAPATVAFSLALGWRAGLVHLVAVGCGLLYDHGLKRTVWSWLPYALAFGALPVIATLATPARVLPGAWVVTAAALFGVAAHLTNALPDLAADRATGVHGLPTRLGARPALGLALALLVAAVVVVAFGPPGSPSVAGWTGLALTAVLVLAAAPALARRVSGPVPFYAVIALVPVGLAMVLLAGNRLR